MSEYCFVIAIKTEGIQSNIVKTENTYNDYGFIAVNFLKQMSGRHTGFGRMSALDINLSELIALTLIIHLIDTLAYSVRLNSVKTGQFALSVSLFNIFVLVSRTANMFQGPLIGSLIGISIAENMSPLWDIRKVVFASTVGTLIGIVLIPTFLKVFSKAVAKLELTGSVPTIVMEALSVSNIKRIAKTATAPSKNMLFKPL